MGSPVCLSDREGRALGDCPLIVSAVTLHGNRQLYQSSPRRAEVDQV